MKKILWVILFVLTIFGHNVWSTEQGRNDSIEALLQDNAYQLVPVPGVADNLPLSCDIEDTFDITYLIQRLRIQPSPSKIFFTNINQNNYTKINTLLMAFPGHTFNIYINQTPLIGKENPIQTAKKIAELPFVACVQSLSFFYYRIGDTGEYLIAYMPLVKANLPEFKKEGDYSVFYKRDKKEE